MVVLHVAGAAFGRELPAFDLPTALELGEDRLVGPADGVGQHVEPAAVRHADHHLAGALLRPRSSMIRSSIGTSMSTPSIEKRFWPEVGLVEELLERLHLGEPLQQPRCSSAGSGCAMGARLDLLPQPDPLLVGRDVFDLVRHGAAVGRLQIRGANRPASRPGTAMRSTPRVSTT